MEYFPGSIIKRNALSGKQFLEGMFYGTNGLVMSQIRDFTGLNTPAIQNWINRGWLTHPQNKRYTLNQVARILIINTLRETMSLESITKLLFYVNGVAGDTRDDIICEGELYGYICDVIFSPATDDTIDDCVEDIVKNFVEKNPGDSLRLKTALKIVYFSYTANTYMKLSECMLRDLP